jgi:hypothetical protein
MPKFIFTLFCILLFQSLAWSQKNDSAAIRKNDSVHAVSNSSDTLAKKKAKPKRTFDPHKATLYSAILPGAGQAYNKKYWKVPIVWTAIGIPTYTYFWNKKWYEKCQFALSVAVSGTMNPDSLNAVDPTLKPLVVAGQTTSIINARDYYRRNQDYSILFILLFWGLNIVDATVDAHLKGFNVSDDLSIRIRPSYIPGPNAMASLHFEFDFHKQRGRHLAPLN